MELNEYQNKAKETCLQSCDNLEYMLLNLQGEVGNLSTTVANGIIKEEAVMTNDGIRIFNDETRLLNNIKQKAGGIIWHLAGVLNLLEISLEDAANCNLKKIEKLQQNKQQ